MASFFPSIAVLGLVAVAALILAIGRPSSANLVTQRTTASRMLAIATAIQAVHVVEEWATGFHVRFPALFGLESIPLSLFVGFNLAWIVFWIASVPLIPRGRRPAFFAAWFLAIAGMLNGVAHPLLAVASGGYFPGLVTSPAIGIAGVFLWLRLRAATAESAL